MSDPIPSHTGGTPTATADTTTNPNLDNKELTPTPTSTAEPTTPPTMRTHAPKPPKPQPKRATPSQSTRSIRALYDSNTITVYQAFNASIASAAVSAQNLAASPLYSRTRMTWIKPSWAWVLYRSGYSYKDSNQERILAIQVTREGFEEILSLARVSGERRGDWKSLDSSSSNTDAGNANGSGGSDEKKAIGGGEVVVQWDPERTHRIGRVDGIRSIQIGIPGCLNKRWVNEWVVGIRDVTAQARELKRVVDEDRKGRIGVQELISRGLVFEERVYDSVLSVGVRRRLGMVVGEDEGVVEEEIRKEDAEAEE